MLDNVKKIIGNLTLGGKIFFGTIIVSGLGLLTLPIEGIYMTIQSAPSNKELKARCEEDFVSITGEIAYTSLPNPHPNFTNNESYFAQIGVNEGPVIKKLIIGEDREFTTGVYLPAHIYFEISDKANLPSKPDGEISIEGICERYVVDSKLIISPLKIQFHNYNVVCDVDKYEVECTSPY